MRRTPPGFTLIELLAVLALVALLAAIAVPGFGRLVDALRMHGARTALSTAFNHARIAAVHRGGSVVVCASADGQTCSAWADWHAGWLVFADDDRNRQRGPGEPILAASGTLPPGLRVVTSAGRPRIAYQPDGSAHGSNVTVTFCDRRGPAAATALVINVYGRVRSGPPGAEAAARCQAAHG
ncbi:GspH/FimT family protein [Dokdonella koreensis]|uniref:Type II secretion system protein H n=1 Tax=Dokdonella koreensis DS-123 TaxID=1300342 RepID=A0A160DVF2_9GAMM|nr:GspH/FimT family protein [Dokdonella koreensis]ANB18509.1 Type IV fimbrial biogenesis protein FimT [Dokdonella koreensis DS-123]